MVVTSEEEQQHSGGPLPWYALRVRSNHEGKVALQLRGRGYEEFSPSYREDRQWSDRKKVLDKYLFPGYVFCRLDRNNRLPVLSVPGVVDFVGVGKVPVPIPEAEMERVRAMVQSGVLVTPWPNLSVGNTVLIERGPLAGLQGILQEIKGKFRIVVTIHLLQRSVAAEIDRKWVRPVQMWRRPELSPHR